ncbi:MAG: DUF5654 family protein [Actinomycetota bacterium]|nr:hypothetical protein [Rubrobacter sp.]MDQ3507699.1 DUF5654 family protein [Actinomycetota bacterium]
MNKEVLDTIITLVTTAFGLVAALAWNEAIQALFAALLPQSGDLAAKFLYAVVVTIIVVLIIIRLGRLAKRFGDEKEEN